MSEAIEPRKEFLFMCFTPGWYERWVRGSDGGYRYAGHVYKQESPDGQSPTTSMHQMQEAGER